MNMITTAANEYANRPKDEAFADLPTMIAAAEYDRLHSKEVSYNLKDLYAMPSDDGLVLKGAKGPATMSHWAFGQLARMVGAPAGYLRGLPAQIAADALNHGIQSAGEQEASLLVKANGGLPHVRSVNTDSYSRLWDSTLYSAAQEQVFSQRTSRGDTWIAPPTWEGDIAGTWRGDRTSFVIRVDGGSIVNDPSIRNGDGRMFRGVMILNSEVGASAAWIMRVLFQ